MLRALDSGILQGSNEANAGCLDVSNHFSSICAFVCASSPKASEAVSSSVKMEAEAGA
jgi:hypothetical protein